MKRYPPSRYIFYPIYRYLRKARRLPAAIAYFAVWAFSGLLHGAVLLGFGHPTAALVFTLIFFGLGAVGTAAIVFKNWLIRRRRHANRKPA